jgi:23S rRNA pseudouridine2605 synthase
LKRRLELPSTGWLRKYRVRVNGCPNDLTFEPLRRGVTIEGEEFLPMEVDLDRQQGANAWLTVGLREGRNREIRRAMSEVNLIVNRLIRVSYGPFRLNQMQPGDVIEVKRKILRDQLGTLFDGLAGNEDGGSARGEAQRKPRAEGSGERPYKPREGRDDRPRKPRSPRPEGTEGKDFRSRAEGSGDRPYRPREERGDAPRKPRAPRAEGSEGKTFRPREDRGDAPRKSWGGKTESGGKPYRQRSDDAPRKPRTEGGEGKGSHSHPRGGQGDNRKPRPAGTDTRPRGPKGGDGKKRS